MSESEMFKTTLMGGYDKDDVASQIRKLQEEHATEVEKLKDEIRKKDGRIQELTKRLVVKEEEKDRLEKDIQTKYQVYIDHYDSISRLVVESQIRGEGIINEAKAKASRIISRAEKEAQRITDSIQGQLDDRVKDGKFRYNIVQKDLDEVVGMINQVQKRFMTAYKEIHQLVKTMPESIADIEENAQEIQGKLKSSADGEAVSPVDPELEKAEATLRNIEKQVRKDLELDEALEDGEELSPQEVESYLEQHGIDLK